MDNLHATIANGLSERYSYLADRVRELAAPLSEEQLWQKPFPFGNSFGHLVLHLTGNLNYYIGTQIAGTGYVRHRDREFTGGGKPKDALLREFDSFIEIALSTIAQQTDADWAKPYSAEREPESKDRFTPS